MRLAFYTVTLSPHQLPLARELVKHLGAENFLYICQKPLSKGREKLGWSNQDDALWILPVDGDEEKRRDWLEHADVLFTYIRDSDLMQRRSRTGLKTIYCSERWFKPLKWGLDGRLRMLSPSYRRRAREIMELAKYDPNFMLYPIGIHAARDFAWLLKCRITDFERRPGGRLVGEGTYLEKMRLWGYFVAPSQLSPRPALTTNHQARTTRILWVGRMLDWKCVDTIIRAVALAQARGQNISLTLVGDGPEKNHLKTMAKRLSSPVEFMGPVPITQVRSLMRQHDVYVLSSNAYEGWGAVVSEAMEEGLCVWGTREAGSTATILPVECLFPAGDAQKLCELMMRAAKRNLPEMPFVWTAAVAASALVKELWG